MKKVELYPMFEVHRGSSFVNKNRNLADNLLRLTAATTKYVLDASGSINIQMAETSLKVILNGFGFTNRQIGS